jgi:hypothetical protein
MANRRMGKGKILFSVAIILAFVLLIVSNLMAGLTLANLESKLSVRFLDQSSNRIFKLNVAQEAIVDNAAALLNMGFTGIKRGDRIKITYCDGANQNPIPGPNAKAHFRIELGSLSQKFEVDQNMNFTRLR